MVNIIGNIKNIGEILGVEECNIICADDNCICGDAHSCDRCDDCKANILGECLHRELNVGIDAVKEMCDACGKCEWLI